MAVLESQMHKRRISLCQDQSGVHGRTHKNYGKSGHGWPFRTQRCFIPEPRRTQVEAVIRDDRTDHGFQRYPTPCTVSIASNPGSTARNFLRMRLMCEVMVASSTASSASRIN